MGKLSLGLLALGVCASAVAAGDAVEATSTRARAILQKYCVDCHGGGKAAKGGFGFVLDRDRLVSRQFIVPGKAAASDLFLRIQQGEMPPAARKLRPTDTEVAVLKRWIDAGATAFDRPVAVARARAPSETLEIIRADLEQVEPRRRRFIRYLTLTHLVAAGRSHNELQMVREAAGKLLNSLSWHPRLTLPESVDRDGTILRIDLRAYKWNAATWAKLVSASPYRLQTTAESRVLADYTTTEDAVLRADWFVATASRPPLYHDLLQLPTSDRALERLLQVDVPGDVQDDSIVRAGFNDSGVSKNNRLIERHDAAYGAFWRSYDFASNTGRQSLFEHPLGPNAGATSFQPSGGEIIFHLPNGLQAYMLIDAKGRRIDKAPSEIVADPRRPDQRVETGISCMSCHARGLLPRADQVRSHVEQNAAVFGKAAVDTIRATHPRKAAFQARIDDDNVRYVKAIETFGARDPDQEPVNLVTQRYEATLDKPTAAAELGLNITELRRFLKEHADQARIFGSLLADGGTIQREVFQAHFAELSRLLLADQAAAAARTAPRVERAFAGHTGTVNAVAFAADGQTAASASDDHSVRLWDIPGGKRLAVLDGHKGEVYAVAFSGDGQSLLSGGADRLARLWNLQTRQAIRVLEGSTAAIRCVALSPDGKYAVCGGDDRALRIFDLASGAETGLLLGHTQSISGVLWNKDGRHVLSSSRDGTLRWWDVASQKQIHCLEGHTGPVLCIALSPDGKTALSGGNDRTLRLWSLAEGKELHCFKGHANAVVQVLYHRAGRYVYSVSSQHRSAGDIWRRWDLDDPREAASIPVQESLVYGCAGLSTDGRHLLVGGPGGMLRLFTRSSAP
jgi:mono/diheme cytochrome c family protein